MPNFPAFEILHVELALDAASMIIWKRHKQLFENTK